jgi:tetratricopeptide (TPR) repeat protein
MADEQPLHGDLADSIAMLEQILEVMPQDIDALKTLYNAYNQCGESDRAFEYLHRMVDVVAMNGDSDSVAFVQGELCKFEDDRPADAAACSAKLPAATGANAVPAVNQSTVTMSNLGMSTSSSADADISEELSLAWRLYEESQLSQEEYSSVLHDLTEVSSKELEVPATVLHVLNDRGFPQMTRIMNHMASRSGVPYIPLMQFELMEEAATALPLAMAAHGGALPFATFGGALLVAVLNPFNSMLVEKIERLSGQRCHTFLAAPEDYDAVLGNLRRIVEESNA